MVPPLRSLKIQVFIVFINLLSEVKRQIELEQGLKELRFKSS
jgi:hypothetical protein